MELNCLAGIYYILIPGVFPCCIPGVCYSLLSALRITLPGPIFTRVYNKVVWSVNIFPTYLLFSSKPSGTGNHLPHVACAILTFTVVYFLDFPQKNQFANNFIPHFPFATFTWFLRHRWLFSSLRLRFPIRGSLAFGIALGWHGPFTCQYSLGMMVRSKDDTTRN